MPFNIAERFIRAAEDELGARLPHSYRQAMMASNGGGVAAYDDVWMLHPIFDKSDRRRLSRPVLREGRLYRPEVYIWLHDTGDVFVVAQNFSELRRAV